MKTKEPRSKCLSVSRSNKDADNIIVLDNGKIIQSGSHNQLVKNKGYYKDLYLKQNSEINE